MLALHHIGFGSFADADEEAFDLGITDFILAVLRERPFGGANREGECSMNGIELQDREFIAAIRKGREPNSCVQQVWYQSDARRFIEFRDFSGGAGVAGRSYPAHLTIPPWPQGPPF